VEVTKAMALREAERSRWRWSVSRQTEKLKTEQLSKVVVDDMSSES
jgi:hypothetical protein